MRQVKPSVRGRRAEQSLREAVAEVIEQSRKLGLPVAVMKNGKAVLIPAEEAIAQVREARAQYGSRSRYKCHCVRNHECET